MNAEQIKERRQEYLSAVKTRRERMGGGGGIVIFMPLLSSIGAVSE